MTAPRLTSFRLQDVCLTMIMGTLDATFFANFQNVALLITRNLGCALFTFVHQKQQPQLPQPLHQSQQPFPPQQPQCLQIFQILILKTLFFGAQLYLDLFSLEQAFSGSAKKWAAAGLETDCKPCLDPFLCSPQLLPHPMSKLH